MPVLGLNVNLLLCLLLLLSIQIMILFRFILSFLLSLYSLFIMSFCLFIKHILAPISLCHYTFCPFVIMSSTLHSVSCPSVFICQYELFSLSLPTKQTKE